MKEKNTLRLILFTLVFTVIIPLAAFGMEEKIEIGQTPSTLFPIIIDQPGNYVLISDFLVSTPDISCLQINSDDVILDLQNHILTGPGQGNSAGICVVLRRNIAILNGTVQGFFDGLNLSGANHEIKNITACNNITRGILAESSSIADCTVSNNGLHGLYVDSCTLTNCTAQNNGSSGITAYSSSITNCTANDNGAHGIFSHNKCRLEGCTLEGNGEYGLYLCPDYSYAIKNKAGNNTIGNYLIDGFHYLPTSGDDANHEF